MELDSSTYPGWTVISIKRHAAWEIHNFLPLVNSMFSTIKEHYDTAGGQLVFDLADLSYFDSTMVSLMLRAINLTGDRKNALIIQDERARDLVTLLGLDRLVDLYDSRAAFQAALSDR